MSADTETGEVIDNQEQPETASQSAGANEVRSETAVSSDAGNLDSVRSAPAESASDEISAPIQEQPAEPAQDGGQKKSVSSAPDTAIESEDSASDASQAPSVIIPHSPAVLLPGKADKTSEAVVPPASSLVAIPDSDVPAFLRAEQAGKKDCLKLKAGHCKIPFETDALCADCANARSKARAA